MHELFGILTSGAPPRVDDFDLKQAEIVLDDEGMWNDRCGRAERAHRIIEEFMLLANETVRRPRRSRGAHPYRIHEEPIRQGRGVRGVRHDLGYSLAAAPWAVKRGHSRSSSRRCAGRPKKNRLRF